MMGIPLSPARVHACPPAAVSGAYRPPLPPRGMLIVNEPDVTLTSTNESNEMAIDSLQKLYVDELKVLYSAENQEAKAAATH